MHQFWINKQTFICYFVLAMSSTGIFLPCNVKAQIEMIHTGSYSQNFDNLLPSGSASWTDNNTIPGWYWQIQNQDKYFTYSATDGTDATSGKKSFGLTGSNDRAMGVVPDKTYSFAMCLVLQNKSSKNISQVSVSYTGEQWLNGGYPSAQVMKFSYKIVSTFNPIITGAGWSIVSALEFDSPKYGTPLKKLNGNLPENSVVFKDILLSGLNIPPGSFLLIRWTKIGENPTAHFLAIDDVTIKWVVPSAPTLSVSPNSITELYGIQDSVASVPKQYLLSGEDLPSGGNPIIITAPTKYEVSLDNQTFSPSCSLAYSTSTLSPQKVYVRCAATTKAGSYSNDLITHTIGGVLLNTIPISGSIYEMNWVENFEKSTQIDNNKEMILGSKGSWIFKDAVIGNTPSDYKRGKVSARLQINNITNVAGSITMSTDKTNGAGDVLISSSNYGSDTGGKWQLQSSINGGISWVNEGSEISCTENPEMAHFTINKSGNIRFRIVQSLAAKASAINIDDIAISDYGTNTSLQWTGSVSNDWEAAGNWAGGVVPGTDSDVEISNVANKPICSKDVSIKSLSIKTGAVLSLKSGITLTVSGNCSFEGTNCMVLKSPSNHGATASFICNGKISGGGTILIERFIIKYVGETDGWHFISSPVDNPLISDSFKPSVDDDLFGYRESDNLWINQKLNSNNLTSFNNGEGYLASYYTEKIRSISGVPNNTDIKFTNLTLTNNRGWHLLGNPFTSGLTWLTGWNTTGINTTAKILNSGGTYSDMEEGEIIPSMNGFFVRAINNTNSITIPTAARVHAISNGWKSKKDSSVKKIKLTISSTSDNTYSETKIILNEKASNQFDAEYDSPFLEGMYGTPLFYSILSNGQKLSTNSIPPASSLLLNFQFIKGISDEYTFKAEISDDWLKSSKFILEDKLEKKKYTLSNSSSFTFKSDSIDIKDRFSLQIDVVTGIDPPTDEKHITLYSIQKTVFLKIPDFVKSGNVTIYDITGKLVKDFKLQNRSLEFNLERTGVYIIKIQYDNKLFSKKISIN